MLAEIAPDVYSARHQIAEGKKRLVLRLFLTRLRTSIGTADSRWLPPPTRVPHRIGLTREAIGHSGRLWPDPRGDKPVVFDTAVEGEVDSVFTILLRHFEVAVGYD